jgi:hypothetical protein
VKRRRAGAVGRGSLIAGVAAAGIVAAAAAASCSGDPAGAGGASGTGATTTMSSSRASIAESTTASAGGGGAVEWEPLAKSPLDCPTARIKNRGHLKAFDWEPCADAPTGCEQMVLSPTLGTGYFIDPTAYEDAHGNVRISLQEAIEGPDGLDDLVTFSDGDGVLLDAYRTSWDRTSSDSQRCHQHGQTTWPGRFGVIVIAKPHRVGGVLVGEGAAEPVVFETLPSPPGDGPGPVWPLGSKRWAWEYGGLAFWSVSATDGKDPYRFAGADNNPILAISTITTTGDAFLYDVYEAGDGGAVLGNILKTDGTHPGSTYLAPGDGTFYVFPAFADTHLGWLRGIGLHGINDFDSMEVWGSPYDPDPTKLHPEKIADYPHGSSFNVAGGHGRFVALTQDDAPTFGEIAVYNLATKVRTLLHAPGGETVGQFAGVTSRHVYAALQPGVGQASDRVIRLALP